MSKQRSTKKSVSLPQDLFEFAEAKAALDGRNLSNYIASLIQKDKRADVEPKAPKAEEQPA